MTELTALKGIGEKSAKLYSKLGIDTVEDALFYFPRDYITYEEITEALVCDRIIAFEATVLKRPLVKRVRRLSITSVMLKAGSDCISAKWFNMPYLNKSLSVGSSYVFRGKIEAEGDHYRIDQPQIFTREAYEELLGHINPIYSLTKGLTNSAVTKTVKKSFDVLSGSFEQEVYDMHFPKDKDTLIKARGKLVYDEFLSFILRLRMLKKDTEQAKNDFHMIEVAQCERLIEKLPYKLTGAQIRVWNEIKIDLCSDVSARRLIQGDVGSG